MNEKNEIPKSKLGSPLSNTKNISEIKQKARSVVDQMRRGLKQRLRNYPGYEADFGSQRFTLPPARIYLILR